MNYPVWEVPSLGSGWVIGIIAIIHVLISHFAIGGGFFLPMAEAKALKEGRTDWIEKLQGFSKFFLILTGVFGAMTGVGIWFAIGLANPEGSSTLIHNFVFGWAIEWVVFMVELSFAAVYYYTWGRVSPQLHLKLGYLYGAIAWLSLFIINGILTFMLTPGTAWLAVAGTGNESSAFFQAFFNPTFWPSLFLRTLVCLSMAGVFALVVFSQMDGDKEGATKRDMIRWSAMWLLPSFILMPVFFGWYLYQVPESQRELLQLGISTIGSGAFTQMTRVGLITIMTSATIVGVVYFFAYQSPRDFTRGHALSVLFLALVATASTEYAREMIRKPYVVGQHMYSNGIRKTEIEKYNTEGYLTHSPWVKTAETGVARLTSVTENLSQHEIGEKMFFGQCMSCHTINGYRGMVGFLHGRDEKAIGNILQMLHEYKDDSPYKKFMPPLVGTSEEIAALRVYLNALINNPDHKKPPTSAGEVKPLKLSLN